MISTREVVSCLHSSGHHLHNKRGYKVNKPEATYWNSWKAYRKMHVLISTRLELVLFGVTLFGVDVLIIFNPLSYHIAFGFLGFGICIGEKDPDPL